MSSLRYLRGAVLGTSALLALAGCADTPTVAPSTVDGAPNAVVIGDPTNGSWTSSAYTAFRQDLTAVVRVAFIDAWGSTVHACTGTNLRLGRQVSVLTAATCVDVAFQQLGAQYAVVTAYNGPGSVEQRKVIAHHVHPWFAPSLNGENNVALLVLDAPFSRKVNRLLLSPTDAHWELNLIVAGYGTTGNSATGAIYQPLDIFGPLPTLRYGAQRMESTCDNFWNCGHASESLFDQWSKGALLVADFDRPGVSGSTNFLCSTLGHCAPGLKREVMPTTLGGQGAPAIADIFVVGIYNTGTLPVNAPPTAAAGLFDTFHTFVCVGDWGVNRGCQDNYNWIVATAP
jgi:hypothetical protein